MAGVGIVLAWFGYSVLYYGLDVVTGGNDSFVDLIWPGRYQPVARDAQGGTASSSKSESGPLAKAAQDKCNPLSPSTWLTGKCSPACLFLNVGCGL